MTPINIPPAVADSLSSLAGGGLYVANQAATTGGGIEEQAANMVAVLAVSVVSPLITRGITAAFKFLFGWLKKK